MRAIVYGGGAREHALAARLHREGWMVTVAPGNAGIARHLPCHPLALGDLAAGVALARSLAVDLALVGPEAPLIAGLADALRAQGIATFGPSAAAARIEGSKAFAKELMVQAGVPTAACRITDRATEARAFASALGGRVAVKADGLAAGKGVVVAETLAEAEVAISAFLEQRTLGEAGARLVLEEVLTGPEVSLMALCHGQKASPLPLSHDYKRLEDGDRGPNTGGMGSVAPSPRAAPERLGELTELAILPILARLEALGTPFSGLLYAGLMLTPAGPRVLEYNCRFGDPETQALLWSFDEPLGEQLLAVARGGAAGRFSSNGQVSAAVVAASPGYPNAPRSGAPITGLEAAEATCAIYVAGVSADREGGLRTNGGRVLSAVGHGATVESARIQAYAGLAALHFDGLQFRRDIGLPSPSADTSFSLAGK